MACKGELTDEIRERSKELLGYEINIKELRLIPYIAYEAQNSGKIDRRKINDDDREGLRRWTSEGRINWRAPYTTITKEFWAICAEIIYLAYVKPVEEEATQ